MKGNALAVYAICIHSLILVTIFQKVLASRKELIEYDARVRDRATSKVVKITSTETMPPRPAMRQLSTVSDAQSVPGRCYGCSSAATEHCVTLLKALALKTSTRDKLISEVRKHLTYDFEFIIASQSSVFRNLHMFNVIISEGSHRGARELHSISRDMFYQK